MLGAPTGVRGRAPLTHLGGAQRRGAGARATELERGAPGAGSSENPPVPIGGNGRGRAEGQTQPPSRAREHLYSRQPASAHRQPSGAGKMENVQPSTQQLSGALASRTPRCSSAAEHRPRCCWRCTADAAGRQQEQRPARAHRAAGPFCSALGSVRQRRRCSPRRCVRCRAAARQAPPSARGAERRCFGAPLRPAASLTINQLLT